MDNADNKLESGPNDLLTEPEVARILRRSTSAIKRYRLTGKLAFIAGRPVLISRGDLRAFIDNEKQRAMAKHARQQKLEQEATLTAAEARAWALEAVRKGRRER